MKKNIIFNVLAFLMILAFFSHTFGICLNPADKTYKLSFMSKKDETLKYDYIFTIKRIAEVKGRKIESNSLTEAVINYSLDDFDDSGNMLISLSFDSLIIESVGPRGKFVAETIKSIGVPILYTLTKRGKVIDTKGLDDLPVIPNFNTKGEYHFKSLLIQLPDKEIKMNDTWIGEWEYTFTDSAGWQKNVFITTYKLVDEVKKNGFDCFKIETTTKEKVSGEQKYGDREVILSGEMELKGEIYFAYKKGIIVEKSYTEDEGKLHMKVTSPSPAELTYINFAKAKFSLKK